MKWRMRILLNICYVILINFVEMNTFFKVLARRHKVDTDYDHQWTIVRVKKQWRHTKSLLIIGQHFMSCWTCFLPEIIYQPFKHHHHHRHHHIYDNIFSRWLCCCKLSVLGLTVIMQSRNCVINGELNLYVTCNVQGGWKSWQSAVNIFSGSILPMINPLPPCILISVHR